MHYWIKKEKFWSLIWFMQLDAEFLDFFPRLSSYWKSALFSPQAMDLRQSCAFYLNILVTLFKLAIWKSAEETIFPLCQLVRLYLISLHKAVNKLNICHFTFFTHFNRTNHRQGLEDALMGRFWLRVVLPLPQLFCSLPSWSDLSPERRQQLPSGLSSAFISCLVVLLESHAK